MRIYFQRTFLFLILRRQSISELGLMLMLILISGLIFARFKNKTFITTPPRLSFPSLCYFIEQEDESSNFTSIPTGIYWVRAYLIFVIFYTRAKYLENKIYIEKTRKLRQNTQKIVNFLRYYGKIHSKLPIFCVITAKYTVNCQFFALNL